MRRSPGNWSAHPREFEAAFAEMVRQSLGAVAIPDYPLFVNNRLLHAELAGKHQLPSIGPSDVVLTGALMAYGVDFTSGRRALAKIAPKRTVA